MAEKGQRTEKPTPKRVEKARREGNFPAAREMVGALQFLTFASMLAAWGSSWILTMRDTMRWLLERAFAAYKKAPDRADLKRIYNNLSVSKELQPGDLEILQKAEQEN